MEEAILGAVAQKAADIIVKTVSKEGSRLAGVKDDLDWIQTEMERIQSYLQDVEATQLKTKRVSKFIAEIWDLAYDVEDINCTYFSESRSSMSNWWVARDFSKKVEGIKKRAEDIKNSRLTFAIDESSHGHEVGKWDARCSFSHVAEPNVVGFDNIISNLEWKVLDKDLQNRVVSIIGMAGLGKTTLAKDVYNAVRRRFDCSAWICVSQRPIVKELLQDIARQVGLKEKKVEHSVEANLFKFLSGKRYVIVVDDIWDTRVWDALKNGLPKNSKKASKIILTSRNKDVGVYVGGSNSIVELQPLDPETSRKLFYKLIMHDEPQKVSETQDLLQLEKIGKQVLERCGGVPLAIVLAARLLKLRERSEVAWRGVLEGMGQEQDQCAEIFALSYNDLPVYLKPCFLYFGLFPEDHEISVFKLINLLAAEGFIRGSAQREVEEVGEEYVNHLIARNLIQVVKRRFNGKVRSCRIHGVFHTLCIRVANAINFFCNQTNVKNLDRLKLRRITIHGSDVDHDLNTPTSRLRALLCFSENRWNKNLDLQDSRFLRVLSVENNKISRSLPTKIRNLRQLTYLKLGCSCSKVDVRLPRDIKNLTSLQTLDLQGAWSVILHDVIWSMKELRHILLPMKCRESKLDVFHRVEFSLPNLQTLYGLPGDMFKADWLRKLTNLRTLLVNNATRDIIEVLLFDAMPVSRKLEYLKLRTYDFKLEKISWNLFQYENLSKLKIDGIRMTKLPQHEKFPPNLTKITLCRTELEKDPMAMETLKKLQKIKFIKLGEDSYTRRN